MSELLGLLDSMESTVLEAKKLPFSTKIVLEEPQLLHLIDKMRSVIRNGQSHVLHSISTQKGLANSHVESTVSTSSSSSMSSFPSMQDQSILLQEAEHKAKEVKQGARDYADFVLANLQLVLTKMQHDIQKMERSIENGREYLDQQDTSGPSVKSTPNANASSAPISSNSNSSSTNPTSLKGPIVEN